SPSPPNSACPCISSASAKASRTSSPSRRAISPAPLPDWKHKRMSKELVESDPKGQHLPPLVKLALELGPLGLFFLANSRPELFAPLMQPLVPASILAGGQAGIFTATAVFMLATLVALAIHYRLVGKLPIMPLVSGVVVL